MRATFIAFQNADSAHRTSASAVDETLPIRTVTAASAKNPSLQATRSSLRRSPFSKIWGDRIRKPRLKGTWTIDGVRAHQDPDDHSGTFTAVSTAITVTP